MRKLKNRYCPCRSYCKDDCQGCIHDIAYGSLAAKNAVLQDKVHLLQQDMEQLRQNTVTHATVRMLLERKIKEESKEKSREKN